MLKKTWMAALAISVLFLGCQDYGFEELPRSVIKEKRWSETISVSSAADILFVVDNSGSMAGEQEQLGRFWVRLGKDPRATSGNAIHLSVKYVHYCVAMFIRLIRISGLFCFLVLASVAPGPPLCVCP